MVARLVKYKTVPILITFMVLSGFLSMFIDSITVMLFMAIADNIPFAATMVPVISVLANSMRTQVGPLAWTLALGTDIGGNATPIGASANVVGTAIAERKGHPISWGRFLKYCFPAMIIIVGLCWRLLLLRYT